MKYGWPLSVIDRDPGGKLAPTQRVRKIRGGKANLEASLRILRAEDRACKAPSTF